MSPAASTTIAKTGRLARIALAVLCAGPAAFVFGSACGGQSSSESSVDASPTVDLAFPFQADPPAVYVAKVKNLLVGLPPTDAEVAAVTADPSSLRSLIDGWMALPSYQTKMLTFFELAFQQTQITAADFVDMIPNNGLGIGAAIPLLVQNIRESFARTALSMVSQGAPLNQAMTTKQLMMTPALMELYAFLDTYHVDDNAKITDDFSAANKGLQIYVENANGPIPIAQTLDPASPNYMHWYDPDLPNLAYPYPDCNVDPIVFPPSSYAIHYLLYGAVFDHKSPSGNCPPRQGTAAGVQMAGTDFSTWKLVTIRPPKAAEAPTKFYDLPALRTATELVIRTPRPGFFSTPAFFANWSTNQSNQMRVTLNQALIVATGKAVDGSDTTYPASTPGLDTTHAAPGTPCVTCHRTLDPTRAILSATYSYSYYTQTDPTQIAQKGLFAFQGVMAPVNTIDDFATLLATHPAFPEAWAQKLCYYANSAACVSSDAEFQRVVGVFKAANFSWNALVRELYSSPLVTNASATDTAAADQEVIAVSRRDHLCAALNARLGLVDVCGLDVVSKKVSQTIVPEIAAGLPSDGYGRGATAPVLPNQPTLFYRAGVENICEVVASKVVDAAADPTMPDARHWDSTKPDAAIADFVSTMVGLTATDARSASITTLLKGHFTAAVKSGATASDALKSTFIVSCLSPSFVGIGM